jgi:hypothetical protein
MVMNTSAEPAIPLAKAIEDLRAELLTALRDGAGQPLQFRLKPIELELKLAVTRSGGVEGGVKFWVLEFGAKGSLESATTHTLKLVLEPVDKDGNPDVKISSVGQF